MRRAIIAVLFSLLMLPRGASSATKSRALEQAMANTPAGSAVATWAFLAPKPNTTPAALHAAEVALTPHARARRQRNLGADHLVDAYDLPVDAAALAAVRGTGAHIRGVSKWLNAVSVDATPQQITALNALPTVTRLDLVHSEKSPELQLETLSAPRNMAQSPAQKLSYDYGSSFFQNLLIDVPAMHDLGYHGQGVIIAVLDTGFNNFGHEAFASLNVLATYDFVNNDTNVSDQSGQMGFGFHGTLVLGTIAGFKPGELIGPAFGATYVLAKTENTSWERHIEEDAWIRAAEWADSIGADIISSSLAYLNGFTNGETGYTWQNMDGATAIITIGADLAGSRGMLIVNAAGNNGFVSDPQNSLGAPADGNMVLTVGATDNQGTRAGYSSVGNTTDNRIKPDVMAMGTSVYTVDPNSAFYTQATGTSLATPLVAGAAALVLQARPNASNIMLMNALRNTAPNHAAPNRTYGWGVIDALQARNAIPTGVADMPGVAHASLVAYPNPFNPATTINYDVAEAGRVTIVAYDATGRRVATLVDENQSAGPHSFRWNAADNRGGTLASGVYMLSLTGHHSQVSRKVVLLK
jgi:subtilisin family serine protease